MLPNTIRLFFIKSDSVSSKESLSTCNPQGARIHGPQADVVALIKKLDCTSRLAAEVRMTSPERRLHQADIKTVHGESDTVMKEICNGIVLKKRLGVDVVITTLGYYQSTIFMNEPLQSSVRLKLGNLCQNENKQHTKIIYLRVSIMFRNISELTCLSLSAITM